MFKKLLSIINTGQSDEQRQAAIYRNMLRDAAKIGGGVFGSIPQGTRREFFCLDEHTWVWHEEWSVVTGVQHVRTTRYDIRPHGIFKAQDGQPYSPVTSDEANRLASAALEYQRRVHEKFDPLIAAAQAA